MISISFFIGLAIVHLLASLAMYVVLKITFRCFDYSNHAQSRIWLICSLLVTSTSIFWAALYYIDIGNHIGNVVPTITNATTGTGVSQAPLLEAIVTENIVAPSKALLPYLNQWFFQCLLVVWSVGVLWRLFSIVTQLRQGHQLIRKSQALSPNQSVVNDEAHPLRLVEQEISPCVIGIRKPMIFIPSKLLALSDDAVTHIIAHEATHIKRRDYLWGIVHSIKNAFFWWCPLRKRINIEIELTKELACDESAIKKIGNQESYAKTLVECATILSTSNQASFATLINDQKFFSRRVKGILAMNMNIKSTLVLPSLLLFGFCIIACTHAIQPYKMLEQASENYLKEESVFRKEYISPPESEKISNMIEAVSESVDIHQVYTNEGMREVDISISLESPLSAEEQLAGFEKAISSITSKHQYMKVPGFGDHKPLKKQGRNKVDYFVPLWVSLEHIRKVVPDYITILGEEIRRPGFVVIGTLKDGPDFNNALHMADHTRYDVGEIMTPIRNKIVFSLYDKGEKHKYQILHFTNAKTGFIFKYMIRPAVGG